MVKSKLLILAMLVSGIDAFAQNCNCETNFQWVQKTFQENDAGFQYAIDVKGKQAFEAHTNTSKAKAKAITQRRDCEKLLYDWLRFFRNGHIAIRSLDNNNSNSTSAATTNPPAQKWETLNISQSEFIKYLSDKGRDDYEGIWETEPYKIGIKKIGANYIGFIIETSAENWKAGDVKVKFGMTEGTFYLRDKSSENFNTVKPIGRNYLQLGRFYLKRLFPKYETEKEVERYFKAINARKPYIDEVNATTLLLRIPSFNGSQKRDIDSVILANRSKILATPTLIIDLRNNGGGSDGSYREIIPFLYTNPIRVVGMQMLSTELNNQRMLDLISNPDYGLDEKDKQWARVAFDTLQKHLGEFVNLDTTKVEMQRLDTVHQFPKNVAILIHAGNGSTTEQFLLAAKQSKKVKLFGTTTAGVLDISNMNFVKSPCKEFELGYSLSKSFRIPHMAIDQKGIQPDYFLDDEIEEHKWLEYVTMTLGN